MGERKRRITLFNLIFFFFLSLFFTTLFKKFLNLHLLKLGHAYNKLLLFCCFKNCFSSILCSISISDDIHYISPTDSSIIYFLVLISLLIILPLNFGLKIIANTKTNIPITIIGTIVT